MLSALNLLTVRISSPPPKRTIFDFKFAIDFLTLLKRGPILSLFRFTFRSIANNIRVVQLVLVTLFFVVVPVVEDAVVVDVLVICLVAVVLPVVDVLSVVIVPVVEISLVS